MSKIMNPNNTRWYEFLLELEKSFDFQNCEGTTKNAEIILKRLDMDVKTSIEGFKEFGGFCDCEILLNAPKRNFSCEKK